VVCTKIKLIIFVRGTSGSVNAQTFLNLAALISACKMANLAALISARKMAAL